ncbi:MAG: flavin reductase [Lachnospiraceae bacterium]|nr:flavin reductase [Lachnospiraceae bacterium]
MEQKVLNRLSYGLFVLTASQDGKDNGCIINTAAQVASDPLTISVAVNKANLTCDMIKETKKFTISILSEDAKFDTFKRFGFQSGRDVDKFDGFSACKRAQNGTMIVTEGTNAYISVDVTMYLDLGSHLLFIGTPTEGELLSDVPSATYSYYHSNIKPKPQKVGVAPDGQTVWRCVICGYEYVGEELPEDFICPICKHPASDFEKVVKK